MKPENEIGLVETPITDCSAVNDGYNLPLSQPVEIWEITYYLFICRNGSMVEQFTCNVTLMICNHCMAVRVRQEAFNNINCVRPGTRTQRDSPKKDGTRAIEV